MKSYKGNNQSFPSKKEESRYLSIQEMIMYSKQRSEMIENYIKQNAKQEAELRPEEKYAERFALADIITTRGGIVPKEIKPSKNNEGIQSVTFIRYRQNGRF